MEDTKAREQPDLRLKERERATRARAAFERTLDLDADLAEAHEGLGMACMQLWQLADSVEERERNSREALQQFTQVVKYFPEYKSGHISLIRALHQAGMKQETEQAIQRARERWPSDPQFLKK